MPPLLFLGIVGLIGFDLVRTLKTGRAHGRVSTITLERRPDAFWRYVYWDCGALAVAVAMFGWSVFAFY